MKKVFLIILIIFNLFTNVFSQQAGSHPQSKEYEWPADPAVRNKLDQWQDLKSGMIESWELCSEDWINRPDSMSYE